MKEVERTGQTYAQIAEDYARHWLNRSAVKAQLDRFVELLPVNARVLDVGCGPGYDTAVFCQRSLRAAGVDLSWEMMEAGKSHGVSVPFIQADMRRLPLVGNAFDGLWVCASLLHLPRTAVPPVLRDFNRVLAPGGVLHLAVKEGQGEAWVATAYGHSTPRFFTYWQAESLDGLLRRSGFKVIGGWRDSLPGVFWLVRFARKSGG